MISIDGRQSPVAATVAYPGSWNMYPLTFLQGGHHSPQFIWFIEVRKRVKLNEIIDLFSKLLYSVIHSKLL